MVETVDATLGVHRNVKAEVRYRAPNRLQTSVTTRLPTPSVQLTVVQVGDTRCQTPPGVCFQTRQRPNATATVRTFLDPALPVNYRRDRDKSGNVVLRLSGTSATGVRYFARLAVDPHSGLPLRFSSRIMRNGEAVASQKATFTYNKRYRIELPKNARRP